MDIFSDYLKYTKETEPPYIFHRWCAIAAIGALLGRNYYIEHGHFRIFPNLYCLLVGEPGSRKSTAIKLSRKLLSASGYDTFAADKTSKEKFLLDLEGESIDDAVNGQKQPTTKQTYDKIMSTNLWGPENFQHAEPKEVYIVADEFNEFVGSGNLDFYTTLGNLWDWDDENKPFTHRLKNSKSVAIFQPTISILGGNTHENFARAFPPETAGIGFLSRLLLIHSEPSGRKYTFPPVPDAEFTQSIVDSLRHIRARNFKGKASISVEASELLDSIYKRWRPLDDIRFRNYSTRRFSQLLKLCIIISAGLGKTEIDGQVVIYSNTILSAAEFSMPKALGEYGKGKNSDIADKILNLLRRTDKPLQIKDIFKHIHNDINKPSEMSEILHNLTLADKIQHVKDKGWLAKQDIARTIEFVDWGVLTEEEKGVVI